MLRFLAAVTLLACSTPSPPSGTPQRRPSPQSGTPQRRPSPPSGTPQRRPPPPPEPPIVADSEFGPLVASLSEPAGVFPSDNFVSNETTVLDVAPALSDPALAGRAYIGVGPEQNLSYVALLRPRVAYLLDIRRGNLLEHLVLRAALEPSETPAAFLSALTSRSIPASVASLDEVLSALAVAAPEVARRDDLVARALALAARLALPVDRSDRASIRAVASAFFEHGTNLRYSMEGTRRPYPTLAQLLAARGPDGRAGSFVADPGGYAFVRDLVRRNGVVPVVGDFAGPHALRAIGVDMRARRLVLGAFYGSNVEEYLFGGGTFATFADSVRTLPTDERSLFLRVWFDRSRPHPLQRPGERMTTVAMPVARMLQRPARRAYRSYWQVITDGLEP